MKQWIQKTHDIKLDKWDQKEKQIGYDCLKQIIQEAWDQITEEDIACLLNSMTDRCQAVIDAHGGNTKY